MYSRIDSNLPSEQTLDIDLFHSSRSLIRDECGESFDTHGFGGEERFKVRERERRWCVELDDLLSSYLYHTRVLQVSLSCSQVERLFRRSLVRARWWMPRVRSFLPVERTRSLPEYSVRFQNTVELVRKRCRWRRIRWSLLSATTHLKFFRRLLEAQINSEDTLRRRDRILSASTFASMTKNDWHLDRCFSSSRVTPFAL